jgi:hypothetical protein
MQLTFTRKTAGIYVAPLNGKREIVLHRAAGTGWRTSIRNTGTLGFGTDLQLVRKGLDAAKIAASTFAGQLVTL